MAEDQNIPNDSSENKNSEEYLAGNTPIPERETRNEKQEINNSELINKDMEVHHHSHSHGKKNWRTYFFEFFMLFLAVTLGFFAESMREHYVEHQREKQYISSLIRDLEKDTVELHSCIQGNIAKKEIYASLWTLLKRPDPFQNIDSLYYYFVPTTYYLPFHATEGTIRQLENAGGLRLIRNANAVDSITAYYDEVRATEGQASTFLRYFDQYHAIAFTVFDYAQIDTMFYDRNAILANHNNYILLTNDKTTIKILFNKLYALWFILEAYLGYLRHLDTISTQTLSFLKKEYHAE